MNLIEKKCPNCGASLEFSDTDKSCKCNYCHRAFEIERNANQINNDSNNIAQQFVLSEVNKSFKMFHFIFILVFIIAFVFIGFIFFNVFRLVKDNNFGLFHSGVAYYTKVSELSNDDYEDIDFDSRMTIDNGEGVGFYTINGKRKREKVYVAYKENSSYIIVAYRVNYSELDHPEQVFTVFVPMVYENINKNQFVDRFSNPIIQAPEYYFDSEKNSYTYGYGSLEEIENNVVKPLSEKNYSITEK